MKTRLFPLMPLVLAGLFGASAWADNLAARDQAFLEQAAQNGQAALSAGRLALTKARHPEVRVLAQRVIDDHTQIDQELRTLAASKQYTPPKEPSMMQKGQEMLIGGLGEDNFDRRYMNKMGVEAHESNIQLFEGAARDAADPDVKAFASRHLPELREHLKTGRDLKAVLESSSVGSKR